MRSLWEAYEKLMARGSNSRNSSLHLKNQTIHLKISGSDTLFVGMFYCWQKNWVAFLFVGKHQRQTNKHPSLVGGFNPFEKYARQISSFPQIRRDENKKYLKPAPRSRKEGLGYTPFRKGAFGEVVFCWLNLCYPLMLRILGFQNLLLIFCRKIYILVGGFNPFEKYYLVKMAIFPK